MGFIRATTSTSPLILIITGAWGVRCGIVIGRDHNRDNHRYWGLGNYMRCPCPCYAKHTQSLRFRIQTLNPKPFASLKSEPLQVRGDEVLGFRGLQIANIRITQATPLLCSCACPRLDQFHSDGALLSVYMTTPAATTSHMSQTLNSLKGVM